MTRYRFFIASALLVLAGVVRAQPPVDTDKQRVLLLLPQGPLLVELLLQIDEQPFDIATGNTFAVQGQAFLAARTDGSQLEQLLDTNGDGQLSEAEVIASSARLRSRDADDNGVVTLAEVAGVATESQFNGGRSLAAQETILLIDKEVDWKTLHTTLVERYASKGALPVEAFRLARTWASRLDRNADRSISSEELAGLATVDASLVLDVSLGTRTRLRETVVVARMADELKRIARIDRGADGKLVVDLISLQVEVLAPNPKPSPRTFIGQATAIVSNFDRDKNGYLERKEVTDPNLAAQFDTWDADGNGQAFADEIRAALERADLPNWKKVSVAALALGNNLLAQLDQDGDQQLGERELQEAAERLRDVALDEGLSLRLAIARGNETYRYLSKGTNNFKSRSNATRPANEGPDWFIHMDTNSDGDITAREFLGTPAQFGKLDTNGDGLLEMSEVR